MSRKTGKTEVVAFKVEAELAEFLNKLPNKSAFIRKAIAAQMKMACPLCNGAGVISRGLHDHFAPVLEQFKSRNCDSCGTLMPLPNDPGELSAEHQMRLEQFFHGGPFLCDDCFDKAPACDTCDWHIPAASVAEHQRTAHDD